VTTIQVNLINFPHICDLLFQFYSVKLKIKYPCINDPLDNASVVVSGADFLSILSPPTLSQRNTNVSVFHYSSIALSNSGVRREAV
jgi:hypothetical protein